MNSQYRCGYAAGFSVGKVVSVMLWLAIGLTAGWLLGLMNVLGAM